MIGAARNLLDRWRGAGEHAITVPPMDGALRPNTAIEDAPVLVGIDAPDNLVTDGARVMFSSGDTVFGLETGEGGYGAAAMASFGRAVTALALSPDGTLAVATEGDGIVLRGGRSDGAKFADLDGRPLSCVTALLFADDDTLLVALGSQANITSQWRHDLLQRNAGGSVWRVDLGSGNAECISDRLAWPCGLALMPDGLLAVSESWRNRIVGLSSGGMPATLFGDIAGYPGRISPRDGGGLWLSVFAPRSQLVEFVLRERDYRESMMREVDPEFWIAPTLSPTQSFLEPMQVGGLKQLGMLKPWAPTRSYGLIVGLDAGHEPNISFHSRADGRRHGITSCVELGGSLLATSKGGNGVVALPLGARGASR